MKTDLLKRKKGRLDSSLLLRTFSLLVMLVVGIDAWAQSLTANLGKQIGNVSNSCWYTANADLFDGYSDDADVYFDFNVTAEISSESTLGHIVSYEPSDGVHEKLVDIKVSKTGWNRISKKLSEVRSVMNAYANPSGVHGINFNAWGGNVDAVRVTIYDSNNAPAPNGWWAPSTNTYSWTDGSNNLMPLFNIPAGKFANYSELDFTTSNYKSQPYRVCFMAGSTKVAQIDFYSEGEKILKFSERTETKDLTDEQKASITSIQFGGLSGSGSITLDPTSVKLIAKSTVVFDAPSVYGATPGDVVTASIKGGDVITSGSQIADGTTIVFTAKQFSNNSKQGAVGAGRLILTGWKLNSDETLITTGIPENGIVWSGSEATYEYTVNGDVTVHAVYGLSYVCKVNSTTGGSATAKVGSTGINESSGLRGGTAITVTAEAEAGYVFDHWEGYLKGAGDDNVWESNGTWSTENPFTFTAAGSTFNNAWGNDIYVTPVFRVNNNIRITYNANGNDGAAPVDANSYSGGTEVTVLAPLKTTGRDGWGNETTFGWWSTNTDGTGTQYYFNDNGVLKNPTITVNEDVTLYAIWRSYAVFQNHTSIAAVPNGEAGETYNWPFNVRGDGYASVKLERKNPEDGKWYETNHETDIWAEINNSDKLPGYGVDKAAVFHNLNLADENAEYQLVLYQTNGIKFRWSKKVIPVKVKMPIGYHTISVNYNGVSQDREFLLHVPDGAAGKVPVLFSLHGAGNDYNSGVANYDALSDNEKVIIVYPRGNYHTISLGDVRCWMSNGVYNEDVKFFEDVIDYLNSHYMIDTDRIYMTGFSNGGMMTYSTAFTSDRFAGFAAVAGYPLNEFHLQHYGNGEWQGSHPVPFMHIHGEDDTFVPCDMIQPIIDNMVYRNGCTPVPTGGEIAAATNNIGEADHSYACTKEYFAPAAGTDCPFVLYKVKNMGHEPTSIFNANGNEDMEWADASQTIIWNFLHDKRRINISDYDGRNRIEFQPGVELMGNFAFDHGFHKDLANNILLQYGDSKTKSLDGTHHDNVYHTIQLGRGWHNISFTNACSNGNTSTMWVTVKVDKLAKLGADGVNSKITPSVQNVFKRDYNVGQDVAFNLWVEDKDITEYRLTFEWHNSETSADAIANAKTIQISNIKIINNTGDTHGAIHGETEQSYFEGYFNYENRLIAQWNFDLADYVRLNTPSLNGSYWSSQSTGANTTIYTYTQSLKDSELTYDGSTVIPVMAGLKFTADANKVQIEVLTNADGTTEAKLILDAGVQLEIPYVRNSYRNDNGETQSPYRWTGDQSNPTESSFAPARFERFQDCLHHINRDIVYFVSSPNILAAGTIDNEGDKVFNNGGPEDVKNSKTKKTWQKCNFCGTQGSRCIVTFTTKTTIDRIGVNRNLVYSFYSENIAETTGGQFTQPEPGLRIIGSPKGAKVADVGDTYATYANAIAMTYGGWVQNYGIYKDGNNETMMDSWAPLNIYHGKGLGEGNQTYSPGTDINEADAAYATDGFPVYSYMMNQAYSETVAPEELAGSHHDQSYGNFYLTTADGGAYADVPNLTPWSLPCRGAHAKFEPTLPGVLNVHILQEPNVDYFIADEFGHLVKDNVYTKVGQNYQVIDKGDEHNDNTKKGHFKVSDKSYVKYSFDVYPGKTYYIFSNAAGMGITGFVFEPYVKRKYNSKPSTQYADEDFEMARIDVGVKTAEMTAGPNYGYNNTVTIKYTESDEVPHMDYTNQTAWAHAGAQGATPKKAGDDEAADSWENLQKNSDPAVGGDVALSNDAVHVTLKRHFNAKQWQSIVLPYSMNNLQLEDVFGKGTKVVLMRDVQPASQSGNGHNTAFFVYHMNQDIIAGYPYLIYPTQEVWSVTTNARLITTPTPLTINGEGPNIVSFNDAKTAPGDDYDGMDEYEFVATYLADQTVPTWSYVMSNGKLTRVTDQYTGQVKCAPFGGYISYTGSGVGARERGITATSFGDIFNDEVTGIEDILLESGIVGTKTNVYSINGSLIRQNTDDLSGLAKGIYIVNGKKYIVK